MQQVVSYTIFLFKQFIISRLVTGQKLRMKDLNQICQNNFHATVPKVNNADMKAWGFEVEVSWKERISLRN